MSQTVSANSGLGMELMEARSVRQGHNLQFTNKYFITHPPSLSSDRYSNPRLKPSGMILAIARVTSTGCVLTFTTPPSWNRGMNSPLPDNLKTSKPHLRAPHNQNTGPPRPRPPILSPSSAPTICTVHSRSSTTSKKNIRGHLGKGTPRRKGLRSSFWSK